VNRFWLPECFNLPNALKAIESLSTAETQWTSIVAASRYNIDYASTIRLDRFAGRILGPAIKNGKLSVPSVRLAVLSTSTSSHLGAGIRVACLGRGIWIDIYEPDYGQIWQEINNRTSGLHTFRPNAVLFAHDAYNLFGSARESLLDSSEHVIDERLDQIRALWRQAKDEWGAIVIQQGPVNPFLRLIGENEH
jgi:hypothetical protein